MVTDEILKRLKFFLEITTRINDDAFFGFIMEYIGIFLDRIKCKGFYKKHILN